MSFLQSGFNSTPKQFPLFEHIDPNFQLIHSFPRHMFCFKKTSSSCSESVEVYERGPWGFRSDPRPRSTFGTWLVLLMCTWIQTVSVFYCQIKKRCFINFNVFFSYTFVRLFAVEASCLINSSVWPAASCLSAHSQLLSHKIVPTSPMELIPINTLRRNSDVFESKRTIVCQRHLCHSAIVLFAQQWSNASFCANTVRWVTSSCLTFCLMWCY